MSGCEFDAWQEEFLIKRHEIENLQNQKEKLGLNTKTASYGFKIRQGITELQAAIGRMKEQNRKLGKKKVFVLINDIGNASIAHRPQTKDYRQLLETFE